MSAQEPSLIRLNVMRIAFFLNFAFLGTNVITSYRGHTGPWESGTTVAYSLWGTLAVLSAIGIRHPLKMLPALLVQFTYKLLWSLLFYLPGVAPAADGLAPVMIGGIVADLIVIPWPFVVRTLIFSPGERWRSSRTYASQKPITD